MAVGVYFPQKNLTLVGSDEERAAGLVYDLHAYRYQDVDGAWHIVTAWRLDPDEIARVAETGIIWLHADGHTQPPLCVQGRSPFEDPPRP
jgi:hypothetical protein